MECVIKSLLEYPLHRRSNNEKLEIINKGRPTPGISKVQNVTRGGKPTSRSFKRSWFDSHSWLTASSIEERLYCWPCLLISNKKSVWNCEGFFDLKNISRGLKLHCNSKEHILCQLGLKGLEKSLKLQNRNIIDHVSEHARLCKEAFNENVRKNRELLKRLIDVTAILCLQELAFLQIETVSNISKQ